MVPPGMQMSVVKKMGLEVGDNRNRKYEIRNGQIITTIEEVKGSKKQ